MKTKTVSWFPILKHKSLYISCLLFHFYSNSSLATHCYLRETLISSTSLPLRFLESPLQTDQTWMIVWYVFVPLQEHFGLGLFSTCFTVLGHSSLATFVGTYVIFFITFQNLENIRHFKQRLSASSKLGSSVLSCCIPKILLNIFPAVRVCVCVWCKTPVYLVIRQFYLLQSNRAGWPSRLEKGSWSPRWPYTFEVPTSLSLRLSWHHIITLHTHKHSDSLVRVDVGTQTRPFWGVSLSARLSRRCHGRVWTVMSFPVWLGAAKWHPRASNRLVKTSLILWPVWRLPLKDSDILTIFRKHINLRVV